LARGTGNNQSFEAGLLEMAVHRECLRYASVRHHRKTDAVGDSPFLVGAFIKELPAGGLQFRRDMNDFDLRSAEKLAIHFRRQRPKVQAAQSIADFHQHQRCCYERNPVGDQNRPLPRSPVMPPIILVNPRHKPRSVQKDGIHGLRMPSR
jgi:hypothetical protein